MLTYDNITNLMNFILIRLDRKGGDYITVDVDEEKNSVIVTIDTKMESSQNETALILPLKIQFWYPCTNTKEFKSALNALTTEYKKL